ncbi:type II toxin-antitoxin system YafO family toxin [Endozoicomonas sp. 4G]|uniref:type II toxin-antitoxin system YafO family toxin n=1 Tax=Endozoicomonas sp. 4G TaxID=2872754 RepID=UPI0020791405|nr:type II toxin-antitoxin system YafO family toxin [Endozoicomonas sp. 4G]
MVRIFTHKDLKDSLGEQKTSSLVYDFRAYKEGKGLPVTFGRDAPYNFTHHRSCLELQHIHFKESGFPLRLIQFRRKSGYVLVYSPGFFSSSNYLLIAIIKHWDFKHPHKVEGTDRDIGLMQGLERIAESFREKF